MCLNVCKASRAAEKISPSCVKCIASGPLTTHQFSAQSVQLFSRYGAGGGRTCKRTAPLTAVKRYAIGSLTAYRISAQSIQPFPRCEKGVRMCTRAAVPHPGLL